MDDIVNKVNKIVLTFPEEVNVFRNCSKKTETFSCTLPEITNDVIGIEGLTSGGKEFRISISTNGSKLNMDFTVEKDEPHWEIPEDVTIKIVGVRSKSMKKKDYSIKNQWHKNEMTTIKLNYDSNGEIVCTGVYSKPCKHVITEISDNDDSLFLVSSAED